ncbi:MAG: P-type conjugative transfer protein TrbL, partial [Zavarzinia sp.]
FKTVAARSSAAMGEAAREGARSAFAATGGSSTAGTVAGDATPVPEGPSAAPAWARRMQRAQSLHQGATTAAHAIRATDGHGGDTSISLTEGDR